MPPPQQQQQQAQPLAMPQVNPNLLSGDDYVYEPIAVEEKPSLTESQNTQSGGMASQFSIVSSALDRNI